MPETDCPFCHLEDRIVSENALSVSVRDLEPAAEGHTLVVPKRHCASFFDLDPDEVRACFSLLQREREALRGTLQPDGFNVGINDGAPAGQRVPHAHVHLIPRFRGDHPDTRGGIRHVIPTRR